MYNRKLYNKVLIKMAKKGTRVVVTLNVLKLGQAQILRDQMVSQDILLKRIVEIQLKD